MNKRSMRDQSEVNMMSRRGKELRRNKRSIRGHYDVNKKSIKRRGNTRSIRSQ